jgi:hypothetical protein
MEGRYICYCDGFSSEWCLFIDVMNAFADMDRMVKQLECCALRRRPQVSERLSCSFGSFTSAPSVPFNPATIRRRMHLSSVQAPLETHLPLQSRGISR